MENIDLRLTKGVFINFCSYPYLEFDYSNQGLTLISGPTGAGKSTLMDAAAWTLYGETSKETAADDVRAWGTSEITTGEQTVETPKGTLTVFRTRGRANQNDLYWTEHSQPETKIRGKDVTETQKILNDRLGATAELYLTSAYFHQFSRADGFFLAKARERRDLLERLADLSLPVRIAAGASEARKKVKSSLDSATSLRDRLQGKMDTLLHECERTNKSVESWNRSQSERVEAVRSRVSSFADARRCNVERISLLLASHPDQTYDIENLSQEIKEIEALNPQYEEAQKECNELKVTLDALKREYKKFSQPGVEVCPTCLGPTDNHAAQSHVQGLQDQINSTFSRHNEALLKLDSLRGKVKKVSDLRLALETLRFSQIERDKLLKEREVAEKAENTHLMELSRLESETNPHEPVLLRITNELEFTIYNHDVAAKQIADLDRDVACYTQLYDMSMDLRGLLLQNTVKDLEAKTNHNLETYFEGELKVCFSLDGDKLEASIQKNGHECNFKQLSGGQRGVLKCSFGVALMEQAANKAGISFNCLFFDEALNGLDDTMKIKAFHLFERLSLDHESVIMIDHSEEFKSAFSNIYQVSLNGDASTITHISNVQS